MSQRSIETTLAERAARYGEYYQVARLAQALKYELRAGPSWRQLGDAQRESLEMICKKLARIVNGDPTYADSWHDIAGYALLVVTELERAAGNAPESPERS